MSILGVGQTHGTCTEESGCFALMLAQLVKAENGYTQRFGRQRFPAEPRYLSLGTGGGNFEEYLIGREPIETLVCYEPYPSDDFETFLRRNPIVHGFTKTYDVTEYYRRTKTYPTCVFAANFQQFYSAGQAFHIKKRRGLTDDSPEYDDLVRLEIDGERDADRQLLHSLDPGTPFVWTANSETEVHVERVGDLLQRMYRRSY